MNTFAPNITVPFAKKVVTAGVVAMLAFLSACGGGGGSAPPVVPPVVPPAATAPSVTTQPASVTVIDGAAASFTVVAAGTAPLTYQWQRNSANIAGATAATYNIASAPLSENSTQYRVVVTNTAGNVTSSAATLTVTAIAPSITTQPQPKTVNDGGTATFTVVAAGSGPLAYQWQRNSVNISGATSGSYTLPSAALGDNGANYRVVVTSTAGSATSNAAALTVNAIVPAITTQPQPQTVADGATATFTVTVTGSAPLTVQWRRNAVNIVGATQASYTTPANSVANSGELYSVVVTNTGGSVTSNNAVLTISSLAPSITTHPVAQTVVEGAAATFTVVATGTQPLTYQWQRNGINIAGATNASYTLAQPSPLDSAAVFRVVVTNTVSTATSNTAALTVTRAPISLLAGKLGGAGSIDGTGSAAQLFNPAATAVDNVGNIYVADRANNTVRKITPAGVVTTIAGQAGVAGYVNAVGNAALFNSPRGIAVSSAGVIYVADTNNNAIRRIATDGTVTTYAGSLTGASGSTDAIGTVATFAQPRGVAVDSLGFVYVADTSNHTIREISISNQTVTTLAGTAGVASFLDGTGAAARFNSPSGLSVDGAGNVIVADRDNNRIRQVTPLGVVTTIAGEGDAFRDDGPVATASFNFPEGVVANSCGDIFVADTQNSSIRKVSAGNVVTVAGSTIGDTGSNDAAGTTAHFYKPLGVAASGCNTLYVADSNNNIVRQIGSSGSYPVTTLAGNVGGKGFADGAALDARFNDVRGVAIDSAGNYIIADLANSVIRKLNPTTGVVSTIAGSPGVTGNVDGDGSSARFDQPIGVAVDTRGTVDPADDLIYVVDRITQTIRKITAGGTVSTIAGPAAGYTTGSTDGTGTAALFNDPRGIAYICDNIYIADFGNHTVRKLNPVTNAVTTFAGAAGALGSVDGTAAVARFNHPRGIAKDGGCNFYLAEYDNNTVRWVNADGSSVTTVAGSAGVAGTADGVGTAAQFDGPTGIVYAGQGVIFVSDSRSHLLRKVAVVTANGAGSTGTVTTLAGQPNSVGVKLGALPGSLGSASGLALIDDTNNVLLVGESLENAVLQITAGP